MSCCCTYAVLILIQVRAITFCGQCCCSCEFLAVKSALQLCCFNFYCCSSCFKEIFYSRRFVFVLNLDNVIHKGCIDIAPLSEPVLVINNKLAIHHVQILILRVQLVLAATSSVFTLALPILSCLDKHLYDI
ncbi:hypothetical protein VNO80_06354 [Phaseolus coccineus]|uniref:Secreted protein n=1 Tax=Phaseolus coccineus TaxID=3886 RepID=A0AAN9RIW3_PHACN